MSGVIGKNTGAPLNSNLMRKLVMKSHGVDDSHIRVVGDTKDAGGNGLKPTQEEFERWQKGEDITSNPNAPGNGPIINLRERDRNTLKTLLQKQAQGKAPIASAPPELPKQMVGGIRNALADQNPMMEFKYNPNAPIPDLNKSFSLAAQKVSTAATATPQRNAPSDLPLPSRMSGGDVTTLSLNEETIIEELPAMRLKRMLTGLGEAMVEAAGGKFGIVDVYSFNGLSYKLTFQHQVVESAGTTGMQIDLDLSDGISSASVSVTVPENIMVLQTLTRHYTTTEALMEDLTNLVEAAGEHV